MDGAVRAVRYVRAVRDIKLFVVEVGTHERAVAADVAGLWRPPPIVPEPATPAAAGGVESAQKMEEEKEEGARAEAEQEFVEAQPGHGGFGSENGDGVNGDGGDSPSDDGDCDSVRDSVSDSDSEEEQIAKLAKRTKYVPSSHPSKRIDGDGYSETSDED